jgi:branched-chain amino acid transport system substrate-binding protein
MRLIRKGATAAVATVACAALVLAGCSSSSSSNSNSGGGSTASLGQKNVATGSTITVGFMTDGKSSGIDNSSEIPTAQAAVQYINQYLGGVGVGHHKLALDTCDNHQTPAGATACGNQFVQNKDLAMLFGVSGQGGTAATPVMAANIPVAAFAATDQSVISDPHNFVFANAIGSLVGGAYQLQQSGGKTGAIAVSNVPSAVGPVTGAASLFYKNVPATPTVVPIDPGTADATPVLQAHLNVDNYFVIDNDQGCTAVLKGLNTLAFKGSVGIIPQCISKLFLTSLAGKLKGVGLVTSYEVAATKDPELVKYQAAMKAYAPSIDPFGGVAQGAWIAVMGFQRMLAGLTGTGAVTSADVIAAGSAMKAAQLPLNPPGTTFQCGTSPISIAKAICTSDILYATLDANGTPGAYKSINVSPLLKIG